MSLQPGFCCNWKESKFCRYFLYCLVQQGMSGMFCLLIFDWKVFGDFHVDLFIRYLKVKPKYVDGFVCILLKINDHECRVQKTYTLAKLVVSDAFKRKFQVRLDSYLTSSRRPQIPQKAQLKTTVLHISTNSVFDASRNLHSFFNY